MKHTLVLAVALSLAAVGCTRQEPKPADEPKKQETAPNTLTKAEQEAGWVLLFDGKSAENWRGFKRNDLPANWKVVDGVLRYAKDDTAAAAGGDIITKKQYADFELKLEWRLAPCGNSGLIYRAVESPQYETVWQTGPEMQLLDNSCHPDAMNGPIRMAGANYDMESPASTAIAKADEWNEAYLSIRNGHVEHWLNGWKMVSYDLGSADWTRQLMRSKFRTMPGYGRSPIGHIALQDHGDRVEFRNIRIRDLSAPADQ